MAFKGECRMKREVLLKKVLQTIKENIESNELTMEELQNIIFSCTNSNELDTDILSNEVAQKLNEYKPETIGMASRISGITPAAISILLVHLKKMNLLGKK